MKEKVQEKRAFARIALFISAVMLTALTFHSCQKDLDMMNVEEIGLKTDAVSEINLDYPEAVTAGGDFTITFSSSCGRIMIERGFTAEVNELGEIINKVYKDLSCDTENLLWEAVGLDEYEDCQGGSITENIEEPGTYVYRAKLNFKAKNKTECPDCEAFFGNQYECFMITVAEGSTYETFTDPRDGKVYKIITIGTQTWMAENLAYNGPDSEGNDIYGIYAYQNDESNVATYGRLYMWDAAIAACPAGWHLPTNDEWNILINYLSDNGYGLEGNATYVAKALASTTGWMTSIYPGNPGYEPESNNSSGFTAMPGGTRDQSGYFWYMGKCADYWTATESSPGSYLATYREVYFSTPWVYSYAYNYKQNAHGVRCVKDAE
ncbi:MAG: FISUMP domain-containing protein [Bacteroides sp.]|jgi:uncharacterized protein (TIGR02145 family)|nr:FISUMP domain-containing protein [Bacteroides sp.]